MERISTSGWRGEVHMSTTDKVLYSGPNKILDISPEVMVEALVAGSGLTQIGFSLARFPIDYGIRTVPGAVTVVPAIAEIAKDANGKRTIGVWRGTMTTSVVLGYDSIFLMNGQTKPFAALGDFGTILLAAGESVSVRWSILLRV